MSIDRGRLDNIIRLPWAIRYEPVADHEVYTITGIEGFWIHDDICGYLNAYLPGVGSVEAFSEYSERKVFDEAFRQQQETQAAEMSSKLKDLMAVQALGLVLRDKPSSSIREKSITWPLN